jgi:hypothetical protein
LGKFVLEKDESYNVILKPEDHIYVFSKWFFGDRPYMTVEGEVRGQIDVSQTTKGAEEKMSKKEEGVISADRAKGYGMMTKIDATQDDLRKEERLSQADKIKEIRDELKRWKNRISQIGQVISRII